MKRSTKLQKALLTVCSLCLALDLFIPWGRPSLLFFGEPKHPDMEQ